MVDSGWVLPNSHVFEVRDTPDAGRGVFARTDLNAGTHILTTTPVLSPVAHVISRRYRREVCAYCFAYDRGKEWKIRLPSTGLSFCSAGCSEDWRLDSNEIHTQALQAVEASIQRHHREDVEVMDVDSEKQVTWPEAEEIGAELVKARSVKKQSKLQRRLLATHADIKVDPDISNLLICGCLMAASSKDGKIPPLLMLAENTAVYEDASLAAHVDAYLHLLTLLPDSLLPYLRADACHKLISRASHNAFSIRPSCDGEQSGEFLGYGVWPEASFLNHSCRPNLSKERQGRLWSFHTSKGVRAGEELCITYLGGDERDLDVNGRRKRLFDEWGFVCQCRGCGEETETASKEGGRLLCLAGEQDLRW